MAAPKTVATYTLDNSKRQFPITFDYLSQNFIQVTLIGGVNKVLVLDTDYRFLSATMIETTLAYGPPSYTNIEIRRVTSATERLVEFNDASILHASDLNVSDLQVIHIAEEARDSITETLGVNTDGDLDARGRKIVNVADAVNQGDAVSVRWYQARVGETHADAVAADAAARAALTYQNAAAASAASALANKNSTDTNADAVAADAASVLANKNATDTNAASALSSKNAAAVSETNAAASAASAAASAAAATAAEAVVYAGQIAIVMAIALG